MDKSIMLPDFWISSRPQQACPEFSARYGLWIFAWHQDYTGIASIPRVRRFFEFYSISHMHEGRGYFISENTPCKEMKPGDAVIIGPGVKHGYGGFDDYYIEDSISFFGPLADQIAHAGMIPNDVVPFGRSRRLLPIIELARDPSLSSQYRANMLLQQLLLDIFLDSRISHDSQHQSKIDSLLTLFRQNLSRHWPIEEMADYCHLSKPHFRRLFLKQTGMLPKQYLLQLKLNHAASLLLSSRAKIHEAASLSGFPDPFHFSRLFKQQFGLSPKNYLASIAQNR